MRTLSKKKIAFVAALAAFLAAGMTGCSDDEADCSKCPADSKAECNSTYDKCVDQESASKCQEAITAFCELAAVFSGDGGLPFGDGG